MRRRRADIVVGALVGLVLLIGGALTWDAYRQRQALDESMGSMMDTSMGGMHGPDPLWYLFGTVVVATVIGGAYLLVRDEITVAERSSHPEGGRYSEPSSQAEPADATPTATPGSEPTEGGDRPIGSLNPEAQPRARVLDLLPDDERRVLEPVLSSPGITQIELRDRSDFSKSKVSQTVTALEERGLLYRERQGRTYRIYPSDDLQDTHSNQPNQPDQSNQPNQPDQSNQS
ncbi:MAG: MarR family transcriptional regulator [Haloarculaceae archaeon]